MADNRVRVVRAEDGGSYLADLSDCIAFRVVDLKDGSTLTLLCRPGGAGWFECATW